MVGLVHRTVPHHPRFCQVQSQPAAGRSPSRQCFPDSEKTGGSGSLADVMSHTLVTRRRPVQMTGRKLVQLRRSLYKTNSTAPTREQDRNAMPL